MATVTGTLAGQPIEGYVRSLRRQGHLCSPGQIATLALSTNFPVDPESSNELIIYEQGVLVFTGYIQKVSRNKPTFDWIVEGMDTYQRVQSTFLESPLTVGYSPETEQPIKNYQPLTTDYWIGYVLSQCGSSYSIESGGHTVPQGVQLGLRSAHETLQDIMAYSSQYAWVNPSGTVEIKRVSRNAAHYHFSDFLSFEYKKDDEWTRTNIKVYGLRSGYGSRERNVFANASVSLPNIVPDRVTAIATPMIQTGDEAQRVADYMLGELGDVTWVATGVIEGDPTIQIGKSARMTYLDFDRTDVITSMESQWDQNGYIMKVTIGERCPRISGWSRLYPPIFAGTTQHGVYKSTDGGINWTEFNTGLPSGIKNVTRLGFNSFFEGMAIVNNSLYYTDGIGDTWQTRSLPSPSNMAGDMPPMGYGRMIAVDASGALGQFSVLTTSGSSSTGSLPAEMRSWIYTCESSGSTPSSWQSVQMSTGSATSHPYNLRGWDLTSSGGAPIAVLSSGSVWASVPLMGWRCEQVTKNRNAHDWFDYSTFSQKCDANIGINWYVNDLYNTPTDTVIDIRILAPTFGRRDSIYLYGSTGNQNNSARTDINGYRYWPFTAKASLIATGEWQVVLQLNNETDPLITFGYRDIYFNIFCLATNALSPYPSITHGDTCGEGHVLGSSPYGDQRGGVRQPLPMPFESTLVAGHIYWL